MVEEASKGAGAEQREREQVLREDLAEAERRLEAAVGRFARPSSSGRPAERGVSSIQASSAGSADDTRV